MNVRQSIVNESFIFRDELIKSIRVPDNASWAITRIVTENNLDLEEAIHTKVILTYGAIYTVIRTNIRALLGLGLPTINPPLIAAGFNIGIQIENLPPEKFVVLHLEILAQHARD